MPVAIFSLPRAYAAPYALSASTVNVAIPAGSSSFVYITATSSSFSGTLPLTTSISGVGITASLNPTSVQLSPGGSAVSKLSFTLPAGTGSGYITVIADSGQGLGQAVVDVYLTVGQRGPGIKVACCFPSGDGKISVTAGQSYTSWAWVYSLNNFTGTVSLSLNVPVPSSMTPSVLTISAGQIAEPDIRVAPDLYTPGGTYNGSLTGTGGSVSHNFPLSITVSPGSGLNQGAVCFSTTPVGCPWSANFSAPVGGSFTVYVVIQASSPIWAFDIWFWYPHSVLNATSISIAGSILPAATTQLECINGIGSPSCGYWLVNGPGVVALHLTGNATAAPTNGLLYSVTFNVTGTGSGSLRFFCVTTPTQPATPDCATIWGASSGVGVQNATFSTDTSGPVGGSTLAVDKLGILMAYLGPISLMLIATGSLAAYLTRISKRIRSWSRTLRASVVG